ncbi:DUF4147 domain-containing protein [Rickettsiales bacterium]|nr:DUF4147 domain-containing protein [Rickettsiales bacterium]
MNTIKFSGINYDPKLLLKELFDVGLLAVKPKEILGKFIKILNSKVIIKTNNKDVEYKNIKRIFPVCIGKASVDTAETVINIFKKKKINLEKGIIVVNKENYREIKGFKCFVSGHPIPNQDGVVASKYIVKYLKETQKDDLVLVFISGGGSSLLPLPIESIELKEKININKLLLESGADINEINTVRKHFSKIKGGQLTNYCAPASVHSLILSDVMGDDLSSISSGLTVPDPTTFKDVKKVLTKYKIWNSISNNAKKYIEKGLKNSNLETPKKNNLIFKKSKSTLIGSNTISLEAIKKYCESKDIYSKIWKKNIEGDVKKVAKEFVSFISSRKKKSPIILISGGETTVKIKGNGKGGRNQEFALHFSYYMKKNNPEIKYSFLSAGTDGRDGPTNAAGGIVDDETMNKIKKKKVDLSKELKNNNSYHILEEIDSLLIIDGTSTNVADIQLIAIIG